MNDYNVNSNEKENDDYDKNVYLIRSKELDPKEILIVLKNFDPLAHRHTDSLINCVPQGKQVFILHSASACDDPSFYCMDRFKWFNSGANKKFGHQDLNLTKSYYDATLCTSVESRLNKDKTFVKYVYKIKDQISPVLLIVTQIINMSCV